MKLKAQTVMEYLLLLAGVMVLLVLISILLRGGILIPAQEEIGGNVATIKAFTSALANQP